MPAKKVKKKLEGEAFVKEIAKLDHEYRIIKANIDLLQAELKAKEREINEFLAENMKAD